MSKLTKIITAKNPDVRNSSLDAFCRNATLAELLAECDALERFRHQNDNLYERVRALFFLYAIHRFHLPNKKGIELKGLVPFQGYINLLKRRFEESIGHGVAIEVLEVASIQDGEPTDNIKVVISEVPQSKLP